ncbi:hypothetical protein Ddye_003286 [Dipteronia dyeriana]|uniref:DDE Tnp4 domain-containing protein n=1 Tax=Dipteronia dyeriana TaxID=168575 RepID=A0AAD9XT66_9ROSI|nr:hypothetical protein Ddye_003286 [Dipteronia dyeriana]
MERQLVGALDETFIQVHVPEVNKPIFRSRKGQIATNALGVCSRDMIFTFILSGWEGSASDSRVLRDALTRPTGLKVPTVICCYYLVDGIYTNGEGFLAPYRGTRYHLSEWRDSCAPVNHEEFFNMKNASTRNFSLYERLANIFGKDRAIGKTVQTPDQQAADFDEGDNFGIDFEISESFSPMSMNQSQSDFNGTQAASQPSSRKGLRSKSADPIASSMNRFSDMIKEAMEKTTEVFKEFGQILSTNKANEYEWIAQELQKIGIRRVDQIRVMKIPLTFQAAKINLGLENNLVLSRDKPLIFQLKFRGTLHLLIINSRVQGTQSFNQLVLPFIECENPISRLDRPRPSRSMDGGDPIWDWSPPTSLKYEVYRSPTPEKMKYTAKQLHQI